MADNKTRTTQQEQPSESGNNILGILTDENGNKKPVTVDDFIEMLKAELDSTDKRRPIGELKAIFEAMIETIKDMPQLIEEEDGRHTFEILQAIYSFLDHVDKIKEVAALKSAEPIPEGTASGVNEYVITKDLLSKAVFGEPGRDGKTISIVSQNPGALTLWTTGKGQNKKEVAIYTRLEFDREALKAAGITIGKNVSKRGREVFGAMLSHYLAGNNLLTLGMIGKIIFNARSDNLTEHQKKYIIDGAQEVFGTSLYVNTAFSTDEARRALISVEQVNKVNIERFETLFPGRITSAYINGNLVETAIELFSLPTLYSLQNALEKGQIMRVPVEALAIPGGRMDEDIISARNYLMRRIDAMKHSPKISRMIIYKNILEEVGIDPTDRAQRTQKTRMLKKVERILDYWKEYPGEQLHITDYRKLTKNGQPVKGTASIYEIEIIL